LAEVEERASTVFRVAGYPLPPDLPISDYRQVPAEAIFVLGNPPVGFARVDEVDGNAHLEELDVLPARMRRGVGGALVEHVCTWAASRGYRAVTLCTFRDVPWNGPFYAKHGFREVDELTPGLVALREAEAAVGLDAVGTRVVMRREL
jgi:GNAT superfamily N-acetyltransferase